MKRKRALAKAAASDINGFLDVISDVMTSTQWDDLLNIVLPERTPDEQTEVLRDLIDFGLSLGLSIEDDFMAPLQKALDKQEQ